MLPNQILTLGYHKKKSVFLNKIRFLAHFLVGNTLINDAVFLSTFLRGGERSEKYSIFMLQND